MAEAQVFETPIATPKKSPELKAGELSVTPTASVSSFGDSCGSPVPFPPSLYSVKVRIFASARCSWNLWRPATQRARPCAVVSHPISIVTLRL